MADIVERVAQVAPPGTVIPKPGTSEIYRVKGWGKRRGEEALIYLIPKRTDPSRPYEKGVTRSELIAAHQQLLSGGELSRAWYQQHFPDSARQAPCNFTTIGGLFQLLGLARYERGLYLPA